MPIYKNRIGTAYEGLEDYEKTEKCYRDALSFLEELKLSGYWNEALFQEKYQDAIETSERAYNKRMKLLGKHPQTGSLSCIILQ